jgi:hypothetical protein
MRSIGLLLLILVAFTSAEPPPPQVMNVYMKDNTANESFWCSEIDPAVGVTFDRTQMRIEIRIIDPNTLAETNRYARFFCLSQIDSITFSLAGAQAHAPEPAVLSAPR